MIVRDAREEDAEAGALLLRESIRHLCVADHNDDPAAIAAWVANMTAAEFRAGCANPASRCWWTKATGELRLLYVAPAHSRTGIGAALLHALEARALARGAREIAADSTISALRFYQAAGYGPTPGQRNRVSKRLYSPGG